MLIAFNNYVRTYKMRTHVNINQLHIIQNLNFYYFIKKYGFLQ
nr:MAG TPA: hypothetical protein [Microviridae sp.]